MTLVTLVSGGLDSSLVAVLASEEGLVQHPLFIDYGQLNIKREWRACINVHRKYGLPRPHRLDLSGWGRFFPSGITDVGHDVVKDAFLPNRNLLFILAASAHAYRVGATTVAIGLLREDQHLFPDQTASFLTEAEAAVQKSLGNTVRVIAPLMGFTKSDVVQAATKRGLVNTYSCHVGASRACGKCIACMEFNPNPRGE